MAQTIRLHCIIQTLVFRWLLPAFFCFSVDIAAVLVAVVVAVMVLGMRVVFIVLIYHREREKIVPQDACCDAAHIVIHYTCMYRKYVH